MQGAARCAAGGEARIRRVTAVHEGGESMTPCAGAGNSPIKPMDRGNLDVEVLLGSGTVTFRVVSAGAFRLMGKFHKAP